MQYSRFCGWTGQWLAVTIREEHRAGEKGFMDFSGDGLEVIDAVTGEVRIAKLFLMVLGGQQPHLRGAYLQRGSGQLGGANVSAFKYFGGAPDLMVPYNRKVGVTRAHRYKLEENPTSLDLSRHYRFAILPARPRRQQDKAK